MSKFAINLGFIVHGLFSIVCCLLLIFLTSTPLFAIDLDLDTQLITSLKILSLAEFNLSITPELISKGNTIRLNDVLKELANYKKHLDLNFTALNKLKGKIFLDSEAKRKFLSIENRMKLLEGKINELKKKIKAAPASNKKNMSAVIDTAYTANERAQGTISSDRNIETNTKITYLLDDASRIDFNGKLSSLYALGSQTQNHDIGISYATTFKGAGKFNSEIGLRPFSDSGNAANTNAESRLNLNYAVALDKFSNLNFKGNYKNQSWNASPAQNYNTKQVAMNFQRNFGSSKDLSTDIAYLLQDASTAANAFSELATGVNYSQPVGKDRKLSIRYSINNRGYPANNTSNYAKNEINALYGIGLTELGMNFVQNNSPFNQNSSYSGFGFNHGYLQKISDAAKWSLKSTLLFRDSPAAASNYSKINLQALYNLAISENQVFEISNSLDDTFYKSSALSFLHNLLGIKYESLLPNNSSVSLSEKFTLDSYPVSTSKNASRHQIDLTYSWPIIPGSSLILNTAYEIKSFISPSATQSDYNSTTLSANFDTKFSQDGKISVNYSNFTKINKQNSAQDTKDGNVSMKVLYNF